MSVEAWKSLFDLATVLLLFLTFAAGAGVLITGNIINKRQESKLHQFDQDLTGAKTELAKQQERAAKAEASIALAEEHSAEADAKAEGFRLDIARSKESAAKSQAQVAEAMAEAAKANLALAKFKAPRTLSVEQQLRIANKMLPFSGQQFAPYVFADAESEALLDMIGRDLNSARWVIVTPKSDLIIGKAGVTSQSGVVIQFSPSRSGDIGIIARKLAEALKDEGIDAVAAPNPTELEATPGVINVIVGSKPVR